MNEPVFARARSSESLDKLISEARDSAEIAEICRNAFPEARNVTRYGEIAVSEIAAPAPQVQIAASSKTPQFWEILYPGGNDRFEIEAHSQQELDEKKRKILATYSR